MLVPCFNLGAFLPEALDSVYTQTRQDFEVIVVNDGSTDPETNRIISALDRPRLQVLSTENCGLAAARNLAASYARGRYLCALDADDALHPDFFRKTLAVLDTDPSVAFVSTWVQCFGLEEWTWRQDRCDLPKLLSECVVLTASPVRRDVFERVGGFDAVSYLYGSEDWDLWISLVEQGFQGTILPEVLFRYRQREGSMRRVADGKEIRAKVWHTLLEKHRDSYERHLQDVLLFKEDECGRLLLENWHLERDLAVHLAPALTSRRAALDALHAVSHVPAPNAADTCPDSERERAALERALHDAHREIAALRASGSWRITAPLRRVLDAWLAVKARFGGGARG